MTRWYTYRPRPTALERWWGVDRLVVPADGGSDDSPAQWLGAVSSLNLLEPDLEVPGELPSGYQGCTRLIADSGQARSGSDAESSLMNWGPKARAAFESACDQLAPALAGAGLRLLVHPRAGDVLSDVPSCLTFLRTHGDGPFGLLLEPSALLADSMIDRAPEHLDRIIGALLDDPRVGAVVATNVRQDARGTMETSPLHLGLLNPALLVRMAHAAVSAGRPVVLHPGDLPGQLHALGAGALGR